MKQMPWPTKKLGESIMKNSKEFRKKVLQIHYDISKGNTWNPVMRTIVAQRLELKDYNDNDLLGTTKYLEDKGYLKVLTNMEDQITDLGIDEVENGFPNLYPENNKEEVVKLAPEIYGIGLNLKALWRKSKKWFKK